MFGLANSEHLLISAKEHNILKKFKKQLETYYNVSIYMPYEQFNPSDLLLIVLNGKESDRKCVKEFLSKKLSAMESKMSEEIITLSDSEEEISDKNALAIFEHSSNSKCDLKTESSNSSYNAGVSATPDTGNLGLPFIQEKENKLDDSVCILDKSINILSPDNIIKNDKKLSRKRRKLSKKLNKMNKKAKTQDTSSALATNNTQSCIGSTTNELDKKDVTDCGNSSVEFDHVAESVENNSDFIPLISSKDGEMSSQRKVSITRKNNIQGEKTETSINEDLIPLSKNDISVIIEGDTSFSYKSVCSQQDGKEDSLGLTPPKENVSGDFPEEDEIIVIEECRSTHPKPAFFDIVKENTNSIGRNIDEVESQSRIHLQLSQQNSSSQQISNKAKWYGMETENNIFGRTRKKKKSKKNFHQTYSSKMLQQQERLSCQSHDENKCGSSNIRMQENISSLHQHISSNGEMSNRRKVSITRKKNIQGEKTETSINEDFIPLSKNDISVIIEGDTSVCSQQDEKEDSLGLTPPKENEPNASTFHQNTETELPQQQALSSRRLRPIVLDGTNIARTHGKVTKTFSSKGIQLAVNYFLKLGHKEITAFVPNHFRSCNPNRFVPTKDPEILEELEKKGVVVFTPSRRSVTQPGKYYNSYDDRFIVKLAVENGGVIVSNDNYRDLAAESEEFKKVIEQRLLMYVFVGDLFMIPDDPLGRDGPKLDDYLSFPEKDEKDNKS